jgi:hypothetical protein
MAPAGARFRVWLRFLGSCSAHPIYMLSGIALGRGSLPDVSDIRAWFSFAGHSRNGEPATP